MDRFLEDWSFTGTYKNPAAMKITHVDACDTGVVFDISYPGTDDQGLWVERLYEIFELRSLATLPRAASANHRIFKVTLRRRIALASLVLPSYDQKIITLGAICVASGPPNRLK